MSEFTLKAAHVKILAGLATMLVVTVGCVSGTDRDPPKTDDDPGKADSPSHHIQENPTNGSDVFQWVDAPREVLDTYRKTIFPPVLGGKALSADHELTTWLQTYVDEMHAYVREVAPDLTKNTPRPNVVVFRHAQFANAWAAGIPVCIKDVSVVFDRPADAGAGKDYFSVALHHNSVDPLNEYSPGGGFGGEPPHRLEDCFEATYSSEVKAFVEWLDSRQGTCRYSYNEEENQIRVSGAGCRVKMGVSDFAGAKSARYYAVIPYIFISTGMLEEIDDEAQIVAVLAHEIGHYYKSHHTNADLRLTGNIFEGSGEMDLADLHFASRQQNYNYFYEQTEVPIPGKPSRLANSDQIRDQVLRFMPNQANPFKGVDGAALDPTLAEMFLDLLMREEVPLDAEASCQRTRDLYRERSFYNMVHSLQLESEEKDAYLALEREFLDCSRRLEVPRDISRERLIDFFTKPMQSQSPTFAEKGSLYDILMELNDAMRAFSREEDEFYTSLERDHIGYYTGEQEADEFAAELLTTIGFDPQAHAFCDLNHGRLREQDAPEAFLRVNRITMDRCEELYRSDWIDPETSEYVFVPIGSLNDIHHGQCFRAFNIKREIVAHQYEFTLRPWSFDHDFDYYRALFSGSDGPASD